MKKIFVVSWFYPPVNTSEGVLTYKLINSSKYEYVVFTQNQYAGEWTYGKSANCENGGHIKVISDESTDQKEWMKNATDYFREHREEFACVMTRSNLLISHEVGAKIKKEFPDIYWIASFGDPIKANPYNYLTSNLYSPYSLDNKINRHKPKSFAESKARKIKNILWTICNLRSIRNRRYGERVEDDTIRLCDKVIFNNFSQKNYMLPKDVYPDKGVIIPHSYMTSLYSKPEKKADGKIHFVYLGYLDKVRTAMPLLKAIRELKAKKQNLADRARFDFYGEVDEEEVLFCKENRLLDIVSFNKGVPYSESLRLMCEADWNIHIDADLSLVRDENLFFAGKLADYFGAGKPILAITMEKGAVVEALKEANSVVCSFDPNEISERLDSIIYNGYRLELNVSYTQQYSSENAARIFDEEILEKAFENK